MEATSNIYKSHAAELGVTVAEYAQAMDEGRVKLDKCGNLSITPRGQYKPFQRASRFYGQPRSLR